MKTAKASPAEITSPAQSHALAISFSLLLLQAISAIAISYWNASENSHDAIVINLSGRQRMLTQRMEKDLLGLNSATKDKLDTRYMRQDLIRSAALFEHTLSMLDTGRIADGNERTFFAGATQSNQAIFLVAQAKPLWSAMQQAIAAMLPCSTQPAPCAALHAALLLFKRDNQQLLDIMNSLTGEIENSAREKSGRLRIIEALAIAFILLNFAFLLFYFRRQLNQLSESQLLAMRIMDNVATAIVVMNAKGNIQSCNHAAEQLFHYPAGTLAGEHITALLEQPYFMQIGKRKDGERFSLEINLREAQTLGSTLFIVSLYDLTEQKCNEEQLIHLAYHDSLTGLPNRILFMDRLAQTIARAHRNHELTAVLYIDLDHFKQVNDTLGHAVGDLLLQNVAQRLQDCVREGDTVARIGGDEFTMIIDAVDVSSCLTVSQKILSALSQKFILHGHTIQISGSIGASLYPNDSCDIKSLLHFADSAMYQAKSQGGNMCCKHPESGNSIYSSQEPDCTPKISPGLLEPREIAV